METKIEKIAFLTGLSGQTGSYLVELLLEKKYIIYGLLRRASTLNTSRIEHVLDKLTLRYGDITDPSVLCAILAEIKNNHSNMTRLEIYNLAAQSHVKVSFEMPIFTAQSTGIGALNLLEAIRICDLTKTVRLYQAGSSEMFGKVQEIPQTEKTPFWPRSPYASSKVFAHNCAINYREAYGMFICNGILFNHESPRRGFSFVTQKIAIGLGKIVRALNAKQKIPCLVLGNLDAKRDFSHAAEMAHGIWLMLQQDLPGDYILSSQEEHSVREFVELCFQKRAIELKWKGTGLDEVGYNHQTKDILVRVHKRYFRPSEVDCLLGDSSKARRELKWDPKITFDQLVTEMVDSECPEHLI